MTPLEKAKHFVGMTNHRGVPTVWFWRDEWYEWVGTHYALRSRSDMERRVLDWLIASGHPSRLADVRSILSLLRLTQEISAQSGQIDTSSNTNYESLTVRNGILKLGSRIRLLQHTPRFLGLNRTEYDYESNAKCPQWEAILEELWRNDKLSIALLQEWFAYCLLPDTSHQKMLAIIGPPRSGKSTIGRVLRGLLGPQSVASPSIRSLSGQFGLWGLLDKLLAIIPDATLPTSCPALEELLKSISGEDPIDVHRKDLPPITSVRLSTKLLILANELPRFRDRSGALANRLLALKTRKSFAEHEDRFLSERLLSELPGILNWSIRGLRRLRKQARFTIVEHLSPARLNRRRKLRQIVLELAETLGFKKRMLTTTRTRQKGLDLQAI